MQEDTLPPNPCVALVPMSTLREQFVEIGFSLIRSSRVLGKDTCSSMDECFSDKELREHLEEEFDDKEWDWREEDGIRTSVPNIVEHLIWLFELEDIFWERNGFNGSFCLRRMRVEQAPTNVPFL